MLSTHLAVGQGLTNRTIHVSGGVPVVPRELDATIDRYRFFQHGDFQGWLAGSRRILYMKSSGGTLQAFVAQYPGDPGEPVTDTQRPVAWVYSDPWRERLVIAEDRDGNERHRLTLHDLSTGRHRSFTNGLWENSSVLWSRSGRMLAFSSTARNGKDSDLYVIEPPFTTTGRRLKEATGVLLAQSWSPDDRRLAVVERAPDRHESRVHLIDVESGQTETLPQPTGTQVARSVIKWSADGGSLYWLTDGGSEFFYLAKYDLATGTETRLMQKIPWDVDRFSLADDNGAAVLVLNENGRNRLLVVDPWTGQELPAPRLAQGVISSVTFRRGSHEFAFEWSCAQSPPGIYSYDLASGQTSEWVRPDPVDGKSNSLPSHAPFRYPSFDGRLIPAYIRRPDPSFAAPRPVLVMIHGGPAAQYSPGFSLLENYLLGELGIALVMPNIRGSTGYGRSYERLDDGPRRPDAVRDLGALLDWISNQPDLDASRVAVSGGSHGGYLALAAMAQYGDRLRAGIDVAGFSDFETCMERERPSAIDYWRVEYGDARDPETRRFLRSISPLAHADRIRKPLLVVHARNDQRVQSSEADQIVSAVERTGSLVWSVQFDREGHSLGNRNHAVYLMEIEILFLKTFLLGH
jgi:dipeptidyl aminopeptidase/acylaminoacyl peptidase